MPLSAPAGLCGRGWALGAGWAPDPPSCGGSSPGRPRPYGEQSPLRAGEVLELYLIRWQPNLDIRKDLVVMEQEEIEK